MREGTEPYRKFIWAIAVAAVLLAPAYAPPLGAQEGHAAPEWGYDCADGPPFLWGERFRLCGEGEAQSPLDVSTTGSVREELPALDPAYGTADVEVENNGHTVEVAVPEGAATLRLGGQSFRMVQFHWHTPSEHWLDGESFPMELHMVHAGDSGRLVLGALVTAGAANGELAKIWAVLPKKPGEHAAVEGFDLAALLPDGPASGLTSYRYPGSLTTPPCDQEISWVLLAEPVTLSPEQIGAFRAIFYGTGGFPVGNARPLQPRNGRTVRTDAGGE